jgi:hypothetical protein
MEKIIVYSVNINGYDEVITPREYDPNVQYILFTDDESIKSDVWEIKPVDFLDKIKDLRKKSRYIKTNPHLLLPEHDVSIYIDSCFEPKFTDTKKMLKDIGMDNNNIMAYKHPERNCLFEEANAVIYLKLDTVSTVSNQMKRYQSMGFPKNYGLFENGFLIRKNNNKVKNFNETWWTEIKNNSGRDQLSHMFSSWYSSVDVTPIEIGKNIDDNEFLHKKIKHKKIFQV